MKIPQKLPQFEDKKTILVAAGNHHGIIYFVLDGKIEKIDEIKIEQPEFSDNEGSFRQGGSQNISHGSVLEPIKGEYEQRFSREMAKNVFKFYQENEIQQIYVFYPSDMSHLFERDWHNDLKKISLLRFGGNYVSETPIRLIEMIQEKRDLDNKVQPEGEAKKILDNNNLK